MMSANRARSPERLDGFGYPLRERVQQLDEMLFLVRLREVVFVPLLFVCRSFLLWHFGQGHAVHLLADMVLNGKDMLALERTLFEVETSAVGRVKGDGVGLGGSLRRNSPTGVVVTMNYLRLCGDLYASGFACLHHAPCFLSMIAAQYKCLGCNVRNHAVVEQVALSVQPLSATICFRMERTCTHNTLFHT